MFGTLSQGSTLYVLDKSNNEHKLKVATIEMVSGQPNLMPYAPTLVGQTIDISVVYPDGSKCKFERLPSNNSVFAYDKAVVTETRELMQQQIESSLRASRAIIDSVPYHQKVITSYETMLKSLSPTFAKEKETDDRLCSLERGLQDIKSMLVKVVSNNSRNNKE